MTRIEENGKLIDNLNKITRDKSARYDELVTLHLANIVITLADISKSLAILADKAERENKK